MFAMRFRAALASLLAITVAATTFVAVPLLPPHLAQAEEPDPAPESCNCPGDKGKASTSRKRAHLGPDLDESDEIAALEGLHLALSEVGDGSVYVWHHRGGRLTGIVRPTASFKDAAGKVCRHVVVELTTAAVTKATEGIACRLANGRWQFDG